MSEKFPFKVRATVRLTTDADGCTDLSEKARRRLNKALSGDWGVHFYPVEGEALAPADVLVETLSDAAIIETIGKGLT